MNYVSEINLIPMIILPLVFYIIMSSIQQLKPMKIKLEKKIMDHKLNYLKW